MTISSQPDTRPSSSLPLSPYGHHRLASLNSSQEPPLLPSFHSSYQCNLASFPTNYSPAGLVTANTNSSQRTNKNARSTLLSPTPSVSGALKHSYTPPEPDTASGYRPLNVIDALAYLDQVKSKFSDKPDIYNQFLDIMKDFKSQAIDTPGVIERVSTLFKGHPALISGFNTFLPSGYRIECSVDPRDPNRIIVTTPNGSVTSTTTTQHELAQGYYIPPATTLPPPNESPLHTHHSPFTLEKRPPVEFNYAINYVNRIKNRFANNPEIYKQFLEILQTYQKEQKPIGEVYAHIQYLFQDADDLLEEFKQFLPEITHEPDHHHGLKRTHSISSTPSTKKKKTHMAKKPRMYDEEQEETFTLSCSFDPQNPSVSMDEVTLFDKTKKYIGSRASYEEFLKLLNLYTQQIIDMDMLVAQVKKFIGSNKELFDAFTLVIGYDPKDHPIERPMVSVPKPDLNHCKAIQSSPSYREVPKDWQYQPCSGRDQLCWEVLNDKYVSYPIWASEDSAFIASKRNTYEEALHRCEEERYDYDLNIEANLNTIALLKPITLQIESMSAEEKNNMRLRPGLGGQTVSIYERIIKKVYDDERGTEIIQMLYNRPASVIPVLLKRLEFKDKEWRNAQKEWNKVWRDQDDKNFYKSLDYQGNSFKANDKKALANKALIAEIEGAQDRRLAFSYEELNVFKDMARLISLFLDRQNGFTKSDKQKVRHFVRSFVSLFFHVVLGEDRSSSIEESDTEDTLDDQDTRSDKSQESQMNLFATAAAFTAPIFDDKNHTNAFLCNSNYYCLFRLFQVFYERLSKFKLLSDRIMANPDLGKKLNKTAIELDLVSNRFDDIDLSKGHYHASLDIIDRFLEGEYDQNTFEENLRYVCGIDAYVMFTVDKLLQSLIKQIQIVSMDKKSTDLLKQYIEKQRSNTAFSAYRDLIEDVLRSDENLYQIHFDKEIARIQLLDRAKTSQPGNESYDEYMSSYINWMQTTKGIHVSLLRPSFLNRNLCPENRHFERICVKSHLRYTIEQQSYHMYYIVGSEDVLYRASPVNYTHHDTSWRQWLSNKGNDVLSFQTKKLLN